MMALICKSRTYQLSIRPNKWNEDDKVNYSHASARRLPAETLFDAVFRVTGSTPQIPGAKPGQRATQLADASMDVGSGLLAFSAEQPGLHESGFGIAVAGSEASVDAGEGIVEAMSAFILDGEFQVRIGD